MRHNYIAIEGVIGAGKTSLAKKIAAQNGYRLLLEEFKNNIALDNFYSAKTEEERLRYTWPMEEYFIKARVNQIREHFAQKTDIPTISDYNIKKCLSFARVNLKSDMFKQYAELFNELTPNLTDPDITFFFQRDIDELFMFKERRNRPNEEYITREYLTNIHLNYLEDFKKHPGKKIVIVDVTGMDFVNNESDYRKVLSIMDRDYEPKITTIENDVVKSLAA